VVQSKRDPELLIAGHEDEVRIWRISDGVCLQRLKRTGKPERFFHGLTELTNGDLVAFTQASEVFSWTWRGDSSDEEAEGKGAEEEEEQTGGTKINSDNSGSLEESDKEGKRKRAKLKDVVNREKGEMFLYKGWHETFMEGFAMNRQCLAVLANGRVVLGDCESHLVIWDPESGNKEKCTMSGFEAIRFVRNFPAGTSNFVVACAGALMFYDQKAKLLDQVRVTGGWNSMLVLRDGSLALSYTKRRGASWLEVRPILHLLVSAFHIFVISLF